MFERTKKELLEIWSEMTIFRDPAPFPWDGETTSHLKKVGKALLKDINDMLNNKNNIINQPLNSEKL